MQRYIALLRAINVGGHTVKMDRLRALFAEMGFADVETFIASGNVIFTAAEKDEAALEARIERDLRAALGYEVGTFLRTPAELAAAAAHHPFGEHHPADGYALNVTFLKSPLDAETLEKVLALRGDVDDFHAHGREVYWLTHGRMSDSPAGIAYTKALGARSTTRNVTTVRKLAAKYPPS